MDIYHFSPESTIAKVEFHQDDKNVWVARLFPQAGAKSEKLAELTAILNQRQDGIIAVPQSEKGVHTLYASGFRSPGGLIGHLHDLGFTGGKPTVEKTSKESDTFAQSIRDASLKLAGIFYLISDAALAGSGIMSGRYKETIAGLLYSSGGVILARYGRKDAHTHLKDLSLKLGDFFTREDIDISPDSPISGANQERQHSIVEGLERFAYSYPSQIFNSIVAICGIKIMESGVQHKKSWDTAAGSLVLGGALAGLVVPEKNNKTRLKRPEDENKRSPDNPIAWAYKWAQDRPLKVPGMLWFGNNIAFFFAALKERKDNPAQKSYYFKFGYVAAALIANALMFISSKQESKRFDIDSDTMQALLGVAANVVQQQPPRDREQIIQQVAGYIASEGGLNCPAEDIANMLRHQVEELAKNPFMTHEPPPKETADKPARKRWASPKCSLQDANTWEDLVVMAEKPRYTRFSRSE